MYLDKLPKPFFVLAPMDDVTDTVFRQIISDCAPPDIYFTEFVNVDALQSKGREKTLPRLLLGPDEGVNRVSRLDGVQGDNENRTNRTNGTVRESRKLATQQSAKSNIGVPSSAREQVVTARKPRPIIAQIWGTNPENFRKSAADIQKMGFDGIDLNFGCPDKNVVRNGACSAFILPENRGKAAEIIQAVREGAPNLLLSAKTRTGFYDVDLSWHEYLLGQKLNMLTIHGRTKVQMSKVPADWDVIEEIRKLRDRFAPETLIIGNGDVKSRTEGEALAQKHGLDGIMIGRGIFHDPFIFSGKDIWESYSKEQKLALYRKHVQLFAETWPNGERKLHTLNKFCKIYIQGFDGAKELREQLMSSQSAQELLKLLN